MASFGIEGIRYFDALRASSVPNMAAAVDLPHVFNVCNGLDRELRASGHIRRFYWANNNCWEADLRSNTLKGIDIDWSDNVDLFFILTHGRNDSGNALLAYNVNINAWIGCSSTWRLGDTNIEWLLIYGCQTVDLANPVSFWNVFQGLHELCGAWGHMWDGWTTDEVGEDVGDNLTSGDSVCDAWINGVSDWFVDNHPVVVAAERSYTWNNGDIIWSLTTIHQDHLWGHGTTVSDIFPLAKFWMSWLWTEG